MNIKNLSSIEFDSLSIKFSVNHLNPKSRTLLKILMNSIKNTDLSATEINETLIIANSMIVREALNSNDIFVSK